MFFSSTNVSSMGMVFSTASSCAAESVPVGSAMSPPSSEARASRDAANFSPSPQRPSSEGSTMHGS